MAFESDLDFLFQDAIRQLASLVTVMFWSRMSDHIGRKPILLLGTLALSISNLSFGLSRTFWALVVRYYLNSKPEDVIDITILAVVFSLHLIATLVRAS